MDNHKTDKQQSSNTANIINFIHSIQTPVETDDFNDEDALEYLNWEREQALRDCDNCGSVLIDRAECDHCGERFHV